MVNMDREIKPLPEETRHLRLFTSDDFHGEEIGEPVINPFIFIQSPLTINIRYAPVDWQKHPDYIYIGRPGKGQDGYFGNPFPLKKGAPRGSTLNQYMEWAKNRYLTDKEFAERVQKLQGKKLVCFCAPPEGLEASLSGAICHGQILAHLSKYGAYSIDIMEGIENEHIMDSSE